MLLSNLCFGQKAIIGLFGKCNSDFSGYVCQQVLFRDDKTFTFYDLLHLRGWTLSEGTWELKGDTVILNSTKQPFTLDYKGSSLSDSITIYVSDSIEPLPFANITLNSQNFSTDFSGTFKFPRQLIDTICISFISTYSGPIIIDKEKIKNIDSLVFQMDLGFYGKYYFDNEKWLIQNKKLFHSIDSSGFFNKEAYFDKVKLMELKYHKDY